MTQSRSKNKILVFIILLLLLTNILVLGYFLYFHKTKPYHKANDKDFFASILRKEVGFNDEQVARFTELKKTHWAVAKAKMDSIVKIKNLIFDLSHEAKRPDSVIEKLANAIGDLQKEVEINAFRHVFETRRICTPEQQPAYDSLMKKIINRGKGGRPGDHPSASAKDK